LRGAEDAYWIRVDDYRVLYSVDDGAQTSGVLGTAKEILSTTRRTTGLPTLWAVRL
jgi:mRNA-degrading endonuclease RelE of RelBE toxin-antitoxin system